jgi:two-component system OmpR family sensor kinase
VLDSARAEFAQRLLVLPEAALTDAPGERMFGAMSAHRELVIYQVFDGQGRLRLRSHTAPELALDAVAASGRSGEGEWRVMSFARGDGSRRVLVAESAEQRREVLWGALGWLLIPLGAVLLGAAGLLHWILRRVFGAMDAARRLLGDRAAEDLRPVAATGLPSEMQPWIGTVNGLILKVRDLVQAERTFAAQTAHEVRTPLAAARAQAQRLTLTATEPAARESAHALVRQLDRLSRLVTRLLQVARIESGLPPKREPVDLAMLARLVADEFADTRAGGRLRVEVQGAADPIEGDLDLLGIALRNLIDNALKYSGSDARVAVVVEPDRISVIDDGPGVEARLLETLARPFERGRVLTEGTGLGLAIVDRIARQSGAVLVLQSRMLCGHGFCARIDFARAGRQPLAPPADAR